MLRTECNSAVVARDECHHRLVDRIPHLGFPHLTYRPRHAVPPRPQAFDHGGFAILEALVEHLALKDYDAHLGTILSLVFTRLQMSRTKKYLRCFVVFFGKLVVKVGAQVVLDKVDGVQPGLAMSIVQGVFGPHLPAVHGSDEEKVALVAAARVLTQTRQMQQVRRGPGCCRVARAAQVG